MTEKYYKISESGLNALKDILFIGGYEDDEMAKIMDNEIDITPIEIPKFPEIPNYAQYFRCWLVWSNETDKPFDGPFTSPEMAQEYIDEDLSEEPDPELYYVQEVLVEEYEATFDQDSMNICFTILNRNNK